MQFPSHWVPEKKTGFHPLAVTEKWYLSCFFFLLLHCGVLFAVTRRSTQQCLPAWTNAQCENFKHNTTLWKKKNVCNFLCSFSATGATSQLAHLAASLLFVFMCGSKLNAVKPGGGERVKGREGLKRSLRSCSAVFLQISTLINQF